MAFKGGGGMKCYRLSKLKTNLGVSTLADIDKQIKSD